MKQETVKIARNIGRCRYCKAVIVVEPQAHQVGRKVFGFCGCRPQGFNVLCKPVRGRVADKTCDSRCVNAVGPSCDCSCGGANHAAGHR